MYHLLSHVCCERFSPKLVLQVRKAILHGLLLESSTVVSLRQMLMSFNGRIPLYTYGILEIQVLYLYKRGMGIFNLFVAFSQVICRSSELMMCTYVHAYQTSSIREGSIHSRHLEWESVGLAVGLFVKSHETLIIIIIYHVTTPRQIVVHSKLIPLTPLCKNLQQNLTSAKLFRILGAKVIGIHRTKKGK